MDEGDAEGGSVCGGGAMKEGSVTQRKWIRKGYFIMHQIRKIHNLPLHPVQNATQLSAPPQKKKKKITPCKEKGGGRRKSIQKIKTVRAPAAANRQN